ncbi:MAG TPA: efflux RND transporter periplasmic adaptor subunit [Blastocatellia bacterium]|nr:efflux RND transporter periplasmic adaptor subunit [Blastocatellia bacterium]
MGTTTQPSTIEREQNAPNAPNSMDAGLKSLRIDRSGKRASRSTRSRQRLRSGILLGFGLLAVLGISWLIYDRQTAATEVETVRVPGSSISVAGGASGATILNATGYIVAAHKVELASKVSGRVAWIGVEKGDRVKQGQPLVRLEDEEFRARLVEAQGQLNSLRARLAALENGSRPEETARSQAELDQVRADLENARVTLDRTRTLVEQGILSRQILDDAQARYHAQTARYASFEKSYALVRIGPRREEIEAIRAQVNQSEGTLALARSQLENTVIRSPISGVVLERNVERGEFVTTSFVGDRGAKGYVASLADLNDLRVELDINQNDFARLGSNQPAVARTDAYPDRKYQGVIAEISPEANRQKATVQVKVKILNPDQYLRPEMNASVAFYSAREPGQQTEALITIPAAAVGQGAVFIVVGGKATRREVQVTGTTPQGVKIAGGLVGGEDLIVNPPPDLKDGEKVRPRKDGSDD